MKGREALAAWADHILASDSITVAECWDPECGWRGALQLSTGRTLLMSSRDMRRMADQFSKAGKRMIEAAGLTATIAEMYDVARVVKRKNAHREIPPDILNSMPVAGDA